MCPLPFLRFELIAMDIPPATASGLRVKGSVCVKGLWVGLGVGWEAEG